MSIVKLNPQIREVKIGIKELRSIKVYPLSMADQFKMTDIIRSVLDELSEHMNKDENNMRDLTEFILSSISDNLPSLLKYVCPEDDISLDDITNFQFTEIVGHVYKDNYEDAGKNVGSLVESLKSLFPSTR